ncbi:MAG: class I SAM-dependent methyltransferase [Anaerolineales bacterium]|jgi:ubiquinone/menaquinone biosynthesis C-methylase UbiE
MNPKPWLVHLLRFFFKHLYTTFAWAYDFVAWATSMGQWRTWQSAALHEDLQDPILELGAGPGHLLLDLLRKGHSAVALDASRQMTRLAADRLRRKGFHASLLRAKAQNIPLPANTFAEVISTFPSEYIFDRHTLEEIWRVLRPGGELIVVGVAHITGRGVHDRLASWLYRFTGQAGDPGDRWMQPLEEMGFKPRLERVRQPRAIVLRFRARKPVS